MKAGTTLEAQKSINVLPVKTIVGRFNSGSSADGQEKAKAKSKSVIISSHRTETTLPALHREYACLMLLEADILHRSSMNLVRNTQVTTGHQFSPQNATFLSLEVPYSVPSQLGAAMVRASLTPPPAPGEQSPLFPQNRFILPAI